MQDQISDFRGLIARWPSMAAFGRDVSGRGADGRVFHRRNRVPRRHWKNILLYAPIQGVTINTGVLERLYQAGRGQGQ